MGKHLKKFDSHTKPYGKEFKRKYINNIISETIHKFIKEQINDDDDDYIDNVIRLQLIDGTFYPTDSLSRKKLRDTLHLDRFSESSLDTITPRLIKRGYKFAISGYEPKTYQQQEPIGNKVGGEPKLVKNPCINCYLKDVCDSDDCGRKYR